MDITTCSATETTLLYVGSGVGGDESKHETARKAEYAGILLRVKSRSHVVDAIAPSGREGKVRLTCR